MSVDSFAKKKFTVWEWERIFFSRRQQPALEFNLVLWDKFWAYQGFEKVS